MFNISSELVLQYSDTSAGESESYIVITFRQEGAEQQSTEMKNSEPRNFKPKVSQVPDDMDRNKGESVPLHT